MTFTCATQSSRCLTCPRSWTLRPFAVEASKHSQHTQPQRVQASLRFETCQSWTWAGSRRLSAHICDRIWENPACRDACAIILIIIFVTLVITLRNSYLLSYGEINLSSILYYIYRRRYGLTSLTEGRYLRALLASRTSSCESTESVAGGR